MYDKHEFIRGLRGVSDIALKNISPESAEELKRLNSDLDKLQADINRREVGEQNAQSAQSQEANSTAVTSKVSVNLTPKRAGTLQISCAEARYILKHLPKEEKVKIPEKLRRFIVENSDNDYIIDLNNLSRRTYALLAVIHRKYLAENNKELQREHEKRLRIERGLD